MQDDNFSTIRPKRANFHNSFVKEEDVSLTNSITFGLVLKIAMKNFLIIFSLLVTTFSFAQVQVQVIRPDSVSREGQSGQQIGEVVTGNIDSMLISKGEVDSTAVRSNVNVYMDSRLAALDNRPKELARVRANAARKRAAAERARRAKSTASRSYASSSKKTYSGNSTAGPGVRNYEAKSVGSGKSKKTVTGSIVTKKGYRIVIYTGSSRQKAISAKQRFMRRYSSVRSYMTYNRPSYKIRVGNFASKSKAYSFLRKIKGSFPSAFVAPDIVTVKNIRVR